MIKRNLFFLAVLVSFHQVRSASLPPSNKPALAMLKKVIDCHKKDDPLAYIKLHPSYEEFIKMISASAKTQVQKKNAATILADTTQRQILIRSELSAFLSQQFRFNLSGFKWKQIKTLKTEAKFVESVLHLDLIPVDVFEIRLHFLDTVSKYEYITVNNLYLQRNGSLNGFSYLLTEQTEGLQAYLEKKKKDAETPMLSADPREYEKDTVIYFQKKFSGMAGKDSISITEKSKKHFYKSVESIVLKYENESDSILLIPQPAGASALVMEFSEPDMMLFYFDKKHHEFLLFYDHKMDLHGYFLKEDLSIKQKFNLKKISGK